MNSKLLQSDFPPNMVLYILMIGGGALSGLIFGFLSLPAAFSLVLLAGIYVIFNNIKIGAFILLITSAMAAVHFPLYTLHFAHFHLCHLMIIVLIAAYAFKMMKIKKVDLIKTSVDTPLILLFLISLLSILNSYISWDSEVPLAHRHLFVQVTGMALVLFSIGAFFIVAREIQSVKWIRIFYFTLIAVALLPALFSIARKVLGFDVFQSRLISTDFGILYIIGLSLGYAGLLHSEKAIIRLRWTFVGCIFLFAIFSRYYSGVRAFPAAVVVILAVSLMKSKKIFIIVLLIVIISGIAARSHLSDELAQEKYLSLQYRLTLWKDTFNVLKQNGTFWLIGVGPGNYYAYSLVYTINAIDSGGWGLTTPHNQYFNTLGELGVIGLACFLWFIVNILKTEFILLKRVKDNFSRSFYSGAIGAFIGILVVCIVADSLIPSVSNQGFNTICTSIYSWILIGLVFSKAKLDIKPNRVI